MTTSLVASRDGTKIGYQSVGGGDALLVIGGAWHDARDYMRFARCLGRSFTVHVVDRRGRGASGPQGPAYAIEREVEDLLAVQAQTGAGILFGHSYGGLVALEAARCTRAFSDVVVYEPGVSIAGSIPLEWMPRYRQLLAAGDRRGAFAAMVRGAGGAPAALEKMPLWYVKLVLRLAIRRARWQHIDPLLESGLAEHEQVAACDEPAADRFQTISARVVVLGGGKSRPHLTAFAPLEAAIPRCAIDTIDGVDHAAPTYGAPEAVAVRVRDHLLRRDREQ